MNHRQQYQTDSLGQSRDYVANNADVARTIAESEARTQLDQALARLAALVTEQGTANRRMAGQLRRERTLVGELKRAHLQPLSIFAHAKLRGVPDFAAFTRCGYARSTTQVVDAARAMAAAAVPHIAVFIRAGFPADTLAQLTAATDAVSAAVSERADTKVNRTKTTKAIEEAILDGREAVGVLHALISKQFADDPAFLAGWHTARHVAAKPGGPRAHQGLDRGDQIDQTLNPP